MLEAGERGNYRVEWIIEEAGYMILLPFQCGALIDKGGVIQYAWLLPVYCYEDSFVVGVGISHNEGIEQLPGTWFLNFNFLILAKLSALDGMTLG